MPHTPTTLFADMLELLKDLQWESVGRVYNPDSLGVCPSCYAELVAGHKPSCRLQSTIALAEEHLNDSR
jgi:hypothetical protein